LTFDYPGYELTFIQKQPSSDASDHLYTLIYKFFSPVTKYFYIIRADYHRLDTFAIKFYCKKDRKSQYKYSKIINKGDLGNILITCAKLVPILLEQYPSASFGFAGARTFDKASNKVENIQNNQRFRTYKYLIAQKFGTELFTHFEYSAISSYLLVNKTSGEITNLERDIVKMFSETYQTLPDIT
jgi:hypothetical protein